MAAVQPSCDVQKWLAACVLLAVLFSGVCGIRCYVCDNVHSRACGLDFKAYQFEAFECGDGNWKCGKQVQDEMENGWIGVSRRCYEVGTLPGFNDSVNACQHWHSSADNFSTDLCLCDRDYCNTAASVIGNGPRSDPKTRLLYLVALLLAVFIPPFLSMSTDSSIIDEPCSAVWQALSSSFSRARLVNLVSTGRGRKEGSDVEKNEEKSPRYRAAETLDLHGNPSPSARSRKLSARMNGMFDSADVADNDVKGEVPALDTLVLFSTLDGASFGERGKFCSSESLSSSSPPPPHRSVAFMSNNVHFDTVAAGSSSRFRSGMRSASSQGKQW